MIIKSSASLVLVSLSVYSFAFSVLLGTSLSFIILLVYDINGDFNKKDLPYNTTNYLKDSIGLLHFKTNNYSITYRAYL